MNKFIVEPAPHLRKNHSTRSIMLNVIIALTPAFIASAVIFGARAVLLSVVCVASSVICEFIFNRVAKKEQTVFDLSAAVTGLILAFNLPPTLPLYMAFIGSAAAIIVVKNMFGGIGQNFANPAAVGRITLMLSFPMAMSNYVVPFYFRDTADVKTSATPLALEAGEALPSLKELFLGLHGGSMGETCALALLIGGLYLVITKTINPATPLAFIGTVALGSFISNGSGEEVLRSLLTGGLLFGAIFMATDYATSPLTTRGKLIFGAGAGLITILIRILGSMPEGVIFSILAMNLLTPSIDKLTRPVPLGIRKRISLSNILKALNKAAPKKALVEAPPSPETSILTETNSEIAEITEPIKPKNKRRSRHKKHKGDKI